MHTDQVPAAASDLDLHVAVADPPAGTALDELEPSRLRSVLPVETGRFVVLTAGQYVERQLVQRHGAARAAELRKPMK